MHGGRIVQEHRPPRASLQPVASLHA